MTVPRAAREAELAMLTRSIWAKERDDLELEFPIGHAAPSNSAEGPIVFSLS